MARPRSDDKRSAVLAAATRIIAAQGLGAATAAIAKEANVSNGSLFTYFATKADLLNALYVEIKTEMAEATLEGLPTQGEIREQTRHLWSNGIGWAVANLDKRRALTHLTVSDDITPASREAGHRAMAGVAGLLEQSRRDGPMHAVPLGFVAALMNALAETTIDFIIRDPVNADQHGQTGFDAFWRMLA